MATIAATPKTRRTVEGSQPIATPRDEVGQQIAHFTEPPLGVTVPAAMRWVSGKTNQRAYAVVLIETADIRRAIPAAKVAAVKAAIAAEAHGSRWSLDYGGFGGTWPARDARGFRIRFNAMKSPAEVSAFLGAVETAVTT
jgi:hypothetical protein